MIRQTQTTHTALALTRTCVTIMDLVKGDCHLLPPPSVQRLGEVLGALDRLIEALEGEQGYKD